MSITFWCPEATQAQVACEACQGLGKVEDILDDELPYRCYECDGTGEVSKFEGPGPNFSNNNAMSVLKLLGLGSEPCGTIRVRDIPAVLTRGIRVLNTDRGDSLQEDGGVEIGTLGAMMVTFPSGSHRERVTRVLQVLAYGKDHNYDVTWG